MLKKAQITSVKRSSTSAITKHLMTPNNLLLNSNLHPQSPDQIRVVHSTTWHCWPFTWNPSKQMKGH